MKYRSELANLTMADIQGLDRARQLLRAIYEGIGATSLQGKPAILALVDEVDDLVVAVIRKGARRAVTLGLKGAYGRKHLSHDLIDRLIELAGFSAEECVVAADSSAEISAPADGDARGATVSGAGELGESNQK
jgi:hypothetical protein